MLPVIALLGRPNVGKSTLFNYLTRSRDALVADMPGLTRDRQYGFGKVGRQPFMVIDTGGLASAEGEPTEVEELMAVQSWAALEEADAVIFMVDGRAGLNAGDEALVPQLREAGKKVWLAVNKTERLEKAMVVADFHELGLGKPTGISATHAEGVVNLVNEILEDLDFPLSKPVTEKDGIRVAMVGRPNVGKSTLINRLIGEERLVTMDMPGTTRDSVAVPFESDGKKYTLIDTAGMRRRSRIDVAIEKFSVIKTMQAIEEANVVVLVLDAHSEIAEQDAKLLGLILQRGRALVIAMNKWDGLETDDKTYLKTELVRRFPYADFVRYHFISALHGTGIRDVMESVDEAHKAAFAELTTKRLNQVLEGAVQTNPPPLSGGRRAKLRYAHQGGRNPPRIIIHGSLTDKLPDSYTRFLANLYRKPCNTMYPFH